MPFAFHRLGFRVFTSQAPDEQCNCSRDPLLGFGSSPEAAQAPSRCLEDLGFLEILDARTSRAPFSSASHEVSDPFSVSPLGAAAEWSSLPCLTACAFRFSQPPGAFIRPEPAGLISCRIRSWGHPPELSSSRAAVRCFQRRSPLGVTIAFRVLLRARVRHSIQRFRLGTSA